MEIVAYRVDTLISKLFLHTSIEISMPDHLQQDMAIILLMVCYLCYVQFYLQVYDEAKGMIIIVLLVESENMDIVLLHKCTMSIATANIAFMGSYALLEVTLLLVNCIVVCYCIPFSFFRVVSLLLHNAGANCLTNLPTLFSIHETIDSAGLSVSHLAFLFIHVYIRTCTLD